MNLHTAASTVRMFITTVDQHTQFLAPDFGATESKYKQHAVYNVALPATVGTDYTGEILKGM